MVRFGFTGADLSSRDGEMGPQSWNEDQTPRQGNIGWRKHAAIQDRLRQASRQFGASWPSFAQEGYVEQMVYQTEPLVPRDKREVESVARVMYIYTPSRCRRAV